jgi:signal transduction histidine kinase
MSSREFADWVTDVEQALAGTRSLRVLVVEDEEVVGEIYDQVLWTYLVDRVTTLAAARAALAARSYQVVVLDKNLPDGNGLDLIEEGRAAHPDLEFIVVSGYASIESATRAVALGAFDYLTKPLPHIQVLTRVVENAMKQSLGKRARAALQHELELHDLLAACIAEEAEKPLATLHQGLDELRVLGQPSDPKRFAADLGAAVAQVSDLVRQLGRMRGVRNERGEPRFDPREAVRAALRLARRELAERVRIVEELEPTPPVRGSVGRLTMAVVDLLLNADAAFEGVEHDVRITVRTRGEGPHALCEVEDNGCGMPPEVAARMFDPFFTTRRLRDTSGIGLALVRQYIEGELGGEIRVDSEPGRGTKVTLLLPLPPPSPSIRPPSQPPPRSKRAGEAESA